MRWSDRVAASSIRTLYRRRGDSLASLACAVERLFSGISVGGAPGLEVIDASVQLTSAWLKESGASRRQKRHQGMAPPPSTRGHAKALSVAPAASSVGSRNQVPIRALRVRRHASHIDAGPRIAMSVVRLRALQRHTQKYRPEWSLRGCVAVTRRTAPLPAAREHRARRLSHHRLREGSASPLAAEAWLKRSRLQHDSYRLDSICRMAAATGPGRPPRSEFHDAAWSRPLSSIRVDLGTSVSRVARARFR